MAGAGWSIRKYWPGLVVIAALGIAGTQGAVLGKLRRVLRPEPEMARPKTLPALRRDLKTAVLGNADATPAQDPPTGTLEKVMYKAPLGLNVAYVTPARSGAKGPGIVWIHGGFEWGIDSFAWEPQSRDNDQSGAAFRRAGLAEMYPALRGASGNPGRPECFLGEVDDVLAAADYLAGRPDVDPQRVYLGGHSTGGVIALLAAESTDRFRAIFSFGPVADPRQYGSNSCIPETASNAEVRPRAPIEYLREITTPTWVIDGKEGNADVFPVMQKRAGRAPVIFVTIPEATHFNCLGPGTELIAKAILADTGPKPAFAGITSDAIRTAMQSRW